MSATAATFRWELFKLYRRPAVWVSVIILLVLALALGYGLVWYIYTHPPARAAASLPRGASFALLKVGLYPAAFVKHTLGQWSTLGGVFALIVGVLSQGSEYGWGTVKTLFTQRPGRLSLLAGKLTALAVLVLVMVVALFAVDAASSYVVALLDGKSVSWPAWQDVAKGIAAAWLIFGFWAVLGFSLATIFRQSAMAIGLGLAYAVLIEGIIFAILGTLGSDYTKVIEPWFPLANAGYLVAAFGQAAEGSGAPAAAPLADATHAVATLLVYVATLIAVSAVLTRRRDVTS
ncbi:MAG TPA: ABC transporter permease subunit [Candidatus Dormibacteraeota bacterium]|nr:ABC transporter permease subunit [Candidatus Dormibacteraeota bacterium]